MFFVKTDDLKEGMRLAKPIYNKKGVLLYERDSHLSKQALDSVKNFGLLGIYVLEPAEPCPPMSEEDIEFEIFQTVAIFKIEDILDDILKKGKTGHLHEFADNIVSKYGRLDHQINFQQSLRSNDDFIYKHSLNVAILCAMITYKLQYRISEQTDCIEAAIVHEIGKLKVQKDANKDAELYEDKEAERRSERSGFSIIEDQFFSAPQIKRMVSQAFHIREEIEKIDEASQESHYSSGNKYAELSKSKFDRRSKILAACDLFDSLTAMNLSNEPKTILGALKDIRKNEEFYGKEITDAFIKSINFLTEGSSVELTSGEKGLIISANDYDIFRPVVLTYQDNRLIDLRQTGRGGPEIRDIVKKFDERHVIDHSIINAAKETIAPDS